MISERFLQQVASSITCHSELAYNQSLEILQLHVSPFGDVARQIGETVDKLESLEKYYKDPVGTIVKGLNATERKLKEIEDELGKYEGVSHTPVPKLSRSSRVWQFSVYFQNDG